MCRRFGIATLVVFSAGCASQVITPPDEYQLISYQGHALPHNESRIPIVCRTPPAQPDTCPPIRLSECWDVLQSGGLRLQGDGTFIMHMRYTNSCTGEVTQAYDLEGAYDIVGRDQLKLHVEGFQHASIRGDTVVIQLYEDSFVFARR